MKTQQKRAEMHQELRGEKGGTTGRYHIYDATTKKLMGNKDGVFLYANKAAVEKAIKSLSALPFNKGKKFSPFPQGRHAA